jgi:hypothetical protein
MSTLPERWAQIASIVRDRILRITDLSIPIEQQLNEEERKQYEMVQRGHILLENCRLWHTLAELADLALKTATIQKGAWQAYIEQQQIRSQVPRFSNPEQVTQQARALRQKSEQFDPTKPFLRQMNGEEREWFEDIKRELELVVEFGQWLEKRN